MNPTIMEYLSTHSYQLRPVDDAQLLKLSPTRRWQTVQGLETPPNIRIVVNPALMRPGFCPNILISASRISPILEPDAALKPEIVLDLLESTVETPKGYVRRAGTRTVENGRHTADTLAEYDFGQIRLATSTVASAWIEGSSTLLRQVVVTTFHDQLSAHGPVLR